REAWQAVSEKDFDPAFETLEALHLVDQIEGDRWAAHRLVCGRARELLGASPELEEGARRAQATNLLALMRSLDDYDIARYSALKSHIEAASSWNFEAAEVGDLLQKAQEFPWRMGEAPLARQWAEEALRIHLR